MRSRRCSIIAAVIYLTFLLSCSAAWARLPSHIDLSYDDKEKILHVAVEHVTKNPRRHFIRVLFVFKNDTQMEKFLYTQQTSAGMLIQDVAIDAASGDVIRVKTRCNEAGYKEETLVIP